MTVAFWILGIFLALAAYFTPGFFVARRGVADYWKHAKRTWTAESNRRKSVRHRFIFVALAWPAVGLVMLVNMIPNPRLITRLDEFLAARRPSDTLGSYDYR